MSDTPIKLDGIEVLPDAKIAVKGKRGGFADLKVGMHLPSGYGAATVA